MQRQQRDNDLAPTTMNPESAASQTAPGKRPLASAGQGHVLAPVQRKAIGASPDTGGPDAAGSWTDVVFRPDLHSGPAGVVQREAATDGQGQAPAAAPGEAQGPEISYQSVMHWVQSSLNVLNQRVSLMDQPLVVDGKNGPKTRAAVKAFQQNAQALGSSEALDVDGKVGPRTTLALEAATGTSNPAGRPPEQNGGQNGGQADNTNGQAADGANDAGTGEQDTAGQDNQTNNTGGNGQSGQGAGDVVHEEDKQGEDEKAGGANEGGDAAISAPSSLSSKSLKEYFNQCLAARYGDKGMMSQMIQISVSSYKVKSDAGGATISEDAAAAWQEVAGAIDALTTDTRQFSIKLAIAMGGESTQYATCTVKFSRRTMTKADDATIAASLITADASHCVGGGRKVAEETYEAFKGLYAAAQTSGFMSEFPDFCKISSAYRSVATQEKLYSDKVAALMAEGQSKEEASKNARKWVAAPGGSAHHTGHALDLKVWPDKLSSSNAKKMADSKSSFHQKYVKYYDWLKENAPKYGFLPYAAEPWHWEKCK